jgi:type IV pilus assembly protein PilA
MRRNRKREQGFSLIELLIVIAIILIIVTVAIPNFTSLQAKANETSAIQSLKTLNMAEMQFQMTNPQAGYTCSIAALGPGGAGNAQQGTNAPAAGSGEGYISDSQLLAGTKSGYIFAITNCKGANSSEGGAQNQTVTSYLITATPVTPGKTGRRFFCTDNSQTIHYSANPNCNPESDPTI